MDKNIQKDFLIRKAWGMVSYISLKDCNAELISSAAHIQDYIIQLCKSLDVKRHGDIQVVSFDVNGLTGFTVVQLLEDSCITAHFNHDINAASIDIFLHKPFTPVEVAEFSKKFFEAKKSDFLFNYRN